MRYSLRTLIVVMLLCGPLCAFAWSSWTTYCEWRALREAQMQTPAPQLLIVFDSLVAVRPMPQRQRLPNANSLPLHPIETAESMPMNN